MEGFGEFIFRFFFVKRFPVYIIKWKKKNSNNRFGSSPSTDFLFSSYQQLACFVRAGKLDTARSSWSTSTETKFYPRFEPRSCACFSMNLQIDLARLCWTIWVNWIDRVMLQSFAFLPYCGFSEPLVVAVVCERWSVRALREMISNFYLKIKMNWFFCILFKKLTCKFTNEQLY